MIRFGRHFWRRRESIKRYVVRLSADERERVEALISKETLFDEVAAWEQERNATLAHPARFFGGQRFMSSRTGLITA